MNIKYRQLKAFTLAARCGSFVQAAELMSVTQPSFSTLIRELEHDLGMPLFERTTRSCRMTAAGTSLYQEIAPVLSDIEDVYRHAREISDGNRGRLAIAAVPSLAFGFVTQVLGAFHRQRPHVRIQMREELNVSVLNAVRQNEVELGIASELEPDADIEFEPLFSDNLMLVALNGHSVLQRPVTWNSIKDYPLILLGSGSAERALLQNKVYIEAAFEVAHMGTAVAMARHDMGITIIPSSALAGLNMSGLQSVPMPGESGRRELGILRRKRKPMSAVARQFCELLRTAALEQKNTANEHAPTGDAVDYPGNESL